MGETIEDEHLTARGAFVEVEHPEAGTVKLLAPWIRFSRTPTEITAPAPLVGQHNQEVFEGLLGLDEAEYEALVQAGVI